MGRFYNPDANAKGLDFGYGPTIKGTGASGTSTMPSKKKEKKKEENKEDPELYVRRTGAGKYSGLDFSDVTNNEDTEPSFSNGWNINTGEWSK
jgi:hypothetical protein